MIMVRIYTGIARVATASTHGIDRCVGTGLNGVWSTIRWATREEAARAAVARCTVEVRAAVEAGRRKEEGVEEGVAAVD